MHAQRRLTEQERLAVLAEYRVMDAEPEEGFDEITAMASMICEMPIALISLVGEDRLWFLSRQGMKASGMPREKTFCDHIVATAEPLVVADASADQRFAANPAVAKQPHIRFYAGIPLTTPEDAILGTLCVLDKAPRTLTEHQIRLLEALARQIVRLMEARRMTARLADALERNKQLAELVPICAWCKKLRDDKDYWMQVDAFLVHHMGADLTHGICPDCMEKMDAEDDADQAG